MLFNSAEFLLFLAVVLPIYYFLEHKKQNQFLIFASLVFYASWSIKFLLPLFATTLVDFLCAEKMSLLHSQGKDKRFIRPYLLISIISNLGLLAFFKYYDFFVVSINNLLLQIGFGSGLHTLNLILPLGISFYTFQALSYSIDVYRGQVHATRKFSDFLLAILYFPHLVAGPIQRASSLLPQITNPRKISRQQIVDGIHLVFVGFLKKVFIADNLSPIVDSVFADSNPSGAMVVLGCYAFAIQIYCDFSGYTDIARGLAKLMGFEFVLNFNLPYFSKSPREFWARWHISLSSWLRDYLYIPLGGNRVTTWKKYRNLLLTMLLGGLWHGAAWNFVLWGAFHGMLLVIQAVFESRRCGKADSVLPQQCSSFLAFCKVILTFNLVCYGWLLFRAQSIEQICNMTSNLFVNFGDADTDVLFKFLLYSLPLIIFQILQYAKGDLNLFNAFRLGWISRTLGYTVVVYLTLFRGGIPQSFIYFQF